MPDQLDRIAAALGDRYALERELGQGGMATVYLAQDPKHDRKVALKVLRPELAAVLGAERFVQEIKTTASLQHPNILPLFDSGQADGFLYYVMPYIQGETLREKLDRETQLGVDDALKITAEVADALNHAHAQGVIHRDIKPENILLQGGRALVADFGIALAVSAAAGGRMTETGLSLGTPHYMSPEQATAEKDLTARSDVYSLASVLYEMLTGNPPHTGASAQQIIMKIVTEEAVPVTTARKSVPPVVAAAITKALEKLPADRFATAADFSAALEGRWTPPAPTATAQAAAQWVRDPRSVAVIALTAAALVVGAWQTNQARKAARIRDAVSLSITLPDSMTDVRPAAATFAANIAISPDDRYVAFSATRSNAPVLFLRRLDGFGLVEVPGGGQVPFFSPDASALGFLRRNEVWRTPLNAMAPVLVGTIPETFWGIESVLWATTGDILAAAASGLWRLPSQGGDPSVVVPLDSALRERMSALSTLDDRRILVSIADSATSRLATIDLDTWQLTRTDEEGPGWYTRGWLLRRGPTHFGARRFDRGTLRTSGEQVAIEGTLGGPATFRWYSMLAVSSGGSAAWFATAEPPREMTWVDTTGRAAPLSQQQPLAFIRWPRVAHDGKRIAFKPEGGLLDVLDLVTGALITLARREGSEPVWLPDGSGIITSMGNRPNHGLVLWPADGRPEQVLLKPAYEPWPTSLSTDGRSLLYYGDAGGPTGEDLFVMDLSTKSSRRIERPGGQRGARFSPDGRWIAYQSEVGGRYQVEVVPWPAADARYVVSVEGGTEPLWSGDSRAIYFRNGDRVMVARVLGGPTFATTPPQELFTGPYLHDPFGDQSWDRAPDGRFLMVRSAETPHIEVRMIRNLPAWLERRERGEP